MATSMVGVTSKKLYATSTLMTASRNLNQVAGIRRSRQETDRSTLQQTYGMRSLSSFVSRACVAENSIGENVMSVPQPIVTICNESDLYATVVRIQFGDVLGDLLDTVAALKNLNLNIVRAKFDLDKSNKHKFYITDADSGEKVLSSARLEEIHQTILNMMMEYHPDSKEGLNSAFKNSRRVPNKKSPTTITLKDQELRTMLEVTTGDRPGLLVDIVGTLKDINVNVQSAKVETIGVNAHDVFAITYHGEALSRPMQVLVENALLYYLQVGEEHSY